MDLQIFISEVLGNNKALACVVTAILSVFVLAKLSFKLLFATLGLQCSCSFRLSRPYELCMIRINDHGGLVVIRVEKLWLTSCYVNRNVQARLLLCLENVECNLVIDSGAGNKQKRIKSYSPLSFVTCLLGYCSVCVTQCQLTLVDHGMYFILIYL